MPNLKVIGKVTVGSGGSATIDFTSIPQTYTDLVLKLSLRSTAAGAHGGGAQMNFNNSTASEYTFKNIRGSGFTTPGSGAASGTTFIRVANNHPTAGNTSNTFCNSEVYIPNYTLSSHKVTSEDNVEENDTAESYSQFVGGIWTNTNAISRITLTSEATLFAQYSSATLYGVSSVTTGSKATGGIVSYDSTYYYHVFPFSGTFTPLQSLTADYLVVAGGASGGPGYQGGGGGAGGYRYLTSQSLTAQAYTVTIGAGGAGVTGGTSARGNNGNDSVFNSITSTGGGGGGTFQGSLGSGNSGGSGGGAGALSAGASGGAGNTPSTSPSQGNNGGGSGSYADPFSGGGGGGSGAAGTTGGGQVGNGGNGTSNSISGISVTYAGGGGGGASYGSPASTGGTGGGGNGANGPYGITAGAGATNTGSGGGGGGDNTQASAAGGSGIVIIRYAI
jgi:hypothetical protein